MFRLRVTRRLPSLVALREKSTLSTPSRLASELPAEPWKQQPIVNIHPVQRESKQHSLAVRGKGANLTVPTSSKSSSKRAGAPVTSTTAVYARGTEIPITSTLKLVEPGEDAPSGTWPVFRLMDENGVFRAPNNHAPADPYHGDKDDLLQLRLHLLRHHPQLEDCSLLEPAVLPFADTQSTHTLQRAHRLLVRIRQMDEILQNAQRQGRISFYMTARGEEAIHLGGASVLDPGDPLFTQYREQGFLMWRGFTLEQFTNQCFSNERDLGKGRQMPVHYGSRALNFHTVSSPLGTQLPQAAGAAYRLKLQGKPNVVVCVFGEGCASTTDFHSALNFAATLSCPVIFLCRNNGYAISTSIEDQYHGDGIVSRGPGYGMASMRVDGNDIFAVAVAMRHARQYALEYNRPVLMECMTYRQGHHSTSDDSTQYRDKAEVDRFTATLDPLTRLENFLECHGLLTPTSMTQIRDEEKMAVLEAIKQAEAMRPPCLNSLFEDIYKDVPPHLEYQRQQMHEHIAKYPKQYSPAE